MHSALSVPVSHRTSFLDPLAIIANSSCSVADRKSAWVVLDAGTKPCLALKTPWGTAMGKSLLEHLRFLKDCMKFATNQKQLDGT